MTWHNWQPEELHRVKEQRGNGSFHTFVLQKQEGYCMYISARGDFWA